MSNLSVKLTLDSNDYSKGLNDAKQATQDFEQKAKQASEGMKGMQDATKKSGNFMREYMKEIKDLKSQLLQLEEGTEEYTQAMQKLADKTFALRDIQETARLSANDMGEQLVLLSKTMGGIVGGFNAVQGALNLFGVENENVQQALLKVQSAMAIVQGLEGLEGLTKTLPLCANAFKGLTATIKTCFATLMKNPWVAVATAILGVVVAVAKLSKGTKELTEEEKKAEAEAKRLESVNNSVRTAQDNANKSAGELWGKYKLLQLQWNLLGDDLNAKKKFIEDNASAFNSLGVEVLTVANIEKIMVDSTGSFCKAMKLRCEALAIQQEILKVSQDYFQDFSKPIEIKTKYKKGDIISKEDSEATGIARQEWKDGLGNSGHYVYHTMTEEEADRANLHVQFKAEMKRNEELEEKTKTYNATMETLGKLLDEKNKQLKSIGAYGTTTSKPLIIPTTTKTTTNTTTNPKNTTTTTEESVDLLAILKGGIKSGSGDVFAKYTEAYLKENPNVEKGSQTYWEDLTSALTTLKDNSADANLIATLEELLKALPTYEKPQEEEKEINVIQLATDAVNSGDFSKLDQYIQTTTQAKQGSVKFVESKINALSEIESTTDDLALIGKVDNEVDRLTKELEQLKKEIRQTTEPEAVQAEENEAQMRKQMKMASDVKNVTGQVTQMVNSLGSCFDDAGQAWLNYVANIINNVGSVVSALQAVACAEAAANQASAGPFGWLAVGVAIASMIASFASIPKYENGGIVGGNSYSGDKLLARVNSGEMVINKSQQARLWGVINGGSTANNSGEVHFKISGKSLVGVLNNYNNKVSKVL